MCASANTEATLSHEAVHLIENLTDLNARIGRLGIALRIPLDTDAAIQAAIHSADPQPPNAVERRSGSERRCAPGAAASPERRTSLLRFELRGLLVMRFGTEIKLIELVGAASSRQIIGSVASTLERQGFLPGARSSLVNREV